MGSVLEPGTCQGLASDSTAPVDSTRYYGWSRFPDSSCGGPSLNIGDASSASSWELDLKLGCLGVPKGDLGVRARWLTVSQPPLPGTGGYSFCNDGSALNDMNITSEAWVKDADMPRWTCVDMPQGPNDAPRYRLLLTSIVYLPCQGAASHLSSSSRVSLGRGKVAIAILS